MENVVYYLVRSLSKNGYLFPNEEDVSEPSQANSACFAFIKGTEELTIKAIDKGDPIDIRLNKVKPESRFWYAHTPYGVIYFKVNSKRIKYVGKKLSQSVRLNWLNPINILKLEELCVNNGFFFVGQTEQEGQ
jgi:hypothetical protein